MRSNAVVSTVVLALAGCGGGGTSPTSQSTPVPTPPPILRVADGITDEVLNAQSVTPPGPRVGDSVTVALDGYMTREQKWTGPQIALWPLPGRHQPQEAYQDLVYGGGEARPLRKWARTAYTVVVAPLVAEWASREAEIRDRLAGVFADVAAAGGPVFSWASAGMSSGDLTVRVDAADECLQGGYAACTRWWHDGSTITRAELIFAEPDYALTDTLSMHMMGYAIGLDDWDQTGAVMRPSWRGRSATFHELERNAIHMMYQHRNAGNLLPDRDPGFTSSGRGTEAEVRRERPGR